MKSLKYLLLLTIGVIAGSCTSCTFSVNPDGTLGATVDPVAVVTTLSDK